jgi:hypothetical protein
MFTVVLYFTWHSLILKIMSNLCPKHMKWHFRDSRFKNFPGEDTPYKVSRLRRLSALFEILPHCFSDFQSFRLPWLSAEHWLTLIFTQVHSENRNLILRGERRLLWRQSTPLKPLCSFTHVSMQGTNKEVEIIIFFPVIILPVPLLIIW